MQFGNPIADGIFLVREALRSANYVAGVSGWTVNVDGTAEFNDVDIRGELNVGTDPGKIRIYGGPNNAGGLGLIQIGPWFIEYDSDGFLSFDSFRVIPQNGGGYTGAPRAQVLAGNFEVHQVSAVGGYIEAETELLVGRLGATGLYTVLNINQLQAFNSGAASPLYLNWSNGGVVNIGTGGLSVNGNVDGNSATLSSFTLSAGILSNAAGTQLGTNIVLPGGQVNCTTPPSGAGPGAGTAWWNNTSGTNYRLSRTTSSRRYKENIRELDGYTPDQLLALVPRWYQRNDHRDYTSEDEPVIPVTEDTPWSAGFIAEEAHDLGLRSWVAYDTEDRPDSFSYGEFAAVAHQVILRAQARKISELEDRITRLERLINA